jgi:hypothetical protein
MSVEINKYHSSKIYKISSSHIDKFYIGSTIKTLNRRLVGHKSHYTHYIEKGMGAYISSFEVVKFDDAIIELIKDVKCENRKELDKIEGDCILEYHERILNKNIPGRTMKEYNEEYRITHKDKIKEYYEINKDRIKEYYEINKDKKKEYYEANKEKLREKIECICGSKYSRCDKSTHNKTKKHQLFISTNQI